MASKSEISLFDSSGNLTPAAIHSYKSGSLNDTQVSKVEEAMKNSPMDAEAVSAYNPDQADRLTKLNARISAKIEKKAGVLEVDSDPNWATFGKVVGGIFIIAAIAGVSWFYLSNNPKKSERVTPEDSATSNQTNQNQVTVEEKKLVNTEIASLDEESKVSAEGKDEKESTIIVSKTDNQTKLSEPKPASENVVQDEIVEKEVKEKVLNITFSINSEYVFQSALDQKKETDDVSSDEPNTDRSEQVLMQYLKENIEVLPDMLSGGSAIYSMTLTNKGTIDKIISVEKYSQTVDRQMEFLLKNAPLDEYALEDGVLRYTVQINF